MAVTGQGPGITSPPRRAAGPARRRPAHRLRHRSPDRRDLARPTTGAPGQGVADPRLPRPGPARSRRHRSNPRRLPARAGRDQVDASALLLSAAACARLARAGDHEAALAHAEAGLALGNAFTETGSDDPLAALRAARASTCRWLVRAQALCRSRLGRAAEALDTLLELRNTSQPDESERCEQPLQPARSRRYSARVIGAAEPGVGLIAGESTRVRRCAGPRQRPQAG